MYKTWHVHLSATKWYLIGNIKGGKGAQKTQPKNTFMDMTLRKPINGNQRKPLDMTQGWHVILWKLVLFGVDAGVILITYNDHVCGNLLNTLRKYHTEPQAHGFYPACVAGTLPKPTPKNIMTMSPEPPPEPTTLLSFSLPYWNGPPIFISLSFHGP